MATRGVAGRPGLRRPAGSILDPRFAIPTGELRWKSSTSYAYDALNRRTRVTEAVGRGVSRTRQVSFDEVGNVETTTDGLNNVTTYSYDALNQRTDVLDALNHRTTATYDAVGNNLTLKDALGKVVTFGYDALHRQVSVTDPLGNQTISVLDPLGQVVAQYRLPSESQQQPFDPLGRPVGSFESRGGYSYTVYDGAGGTRMFVDPVGNEWHYTVDGVGREIVRTDPAGKAVTTVYDAVGRVTQVTDRNDRVMQYSYDAGDRLTAATWKFSAGVTVNLLTYTYDDNDNRLTAKDTNGTVTYTFDELNRVASYRNVFGQALTYSYDAEDRSTKREDSLGGVQTSVYNAVGLLTSRQFGGVGQTPVRVDFGYTNRYEQSTITRYSDVAGTSVVGTTVYSYDDAAHLTSIINKDNAATTLSYYTYTYDSADRVTSHTWWSQVGTVVYSGTRAYGYDSTSQLTSDGSATYTYDANGNRTMTGYQTGVANRMTNDGTFTYTYDHEGNLADKGKGTGLEKWFYTWDNANRLTNVRKTSDGSTTTLSVTYTYDVEGNRVQEDKWVSGVGSTTTRFAYDGAHQWADLDGANSVLVRYVHGDRIDQILARIVASGTHIGVAHFLTDNLGTVRDIADGSMVIQYHADVDGFGGIAEVNAGWGDRFKFTGREYDADTGLQYNRARWYDTRTGRWLSEDPISFTAGDANLFRYVRNGATNGVDPSGLEKRIKAPSISCSDCTGGYGTGPTFTPVRDPVFDFVFGKEPNDYLNPPKFIATLIVAPDIALTPGSYRGGLKRSGELPSDFVPPRSGGGLVSVPLPGEVLLGMPAFSPDKAAKHVLAGSLKSEFPSQFLDKSLNQIKDMLITATGLEKRSLQKAKKLLEQQARLLGD